MSVACEEMMNLLSRLIAHNEMSNTNADIEFGASDETKIRIDDMGFVLLMKPASGIEISMEECLSLS